MSKCKTIPVKTWQFFHACKKNLGMATLVKMFKVSPRQIDRWACDPAYAESSQHNPVDRYESLLKKLVDRGVDDIAMAAVDRQAKIVGCTLRSDVIYPDKKNLAEELLDNLPALADYQEAVRLKEPMAVIRGKARRVILEIEEDLVLMEQEAL